MREEEGWLKFHNITARLQKATFSGNVGKAICDYCEGDFAECVAFKTGKYTLRICKNCCSDLGLEFAEKKEVWR